MNHEAYGARRHGCVLLIFSVTVFIESEHQARCKDRWLYFITLAVVSKASL